ncbi:MAG: 50S ribosomal protein L13 [Patescibacteria group bacterium]|nr:50S ribosomal protein L13 [Patescibacteria group bacterium]MDE2437857.1 50S ribosomal protein L13 [Patescibacteria group bacterium]
MAHSSGTIEIDVRDKMVGRVASHIASLLQDKHKPAYEPRLAGTTVVRVANVDKIKFSGKKMEQKIYYKHTRYPGHLKERSAENIFEKDPKQILKIAVYRMLPKNKLRARRIKRLLFV